MSTIRGLLCAGLALMLGASVGCAANTAKEVSLDTGRDDERVELDDMLANISVWDGKQDEDIDRSAWFQERFPEQYAEEYEEEPYNGPTVSLITPDYSEQILEKRDINPFTAGWLHVPGTEIDDVILKNPSFKDNDYYLTRNFYNEPDRDGAYCVDYRSEPFGKRSKLTGITAIYGHSWDDNPNGGLFSQLKKYRSASFAREHPYIFFSTATDDMVWEVFAVFDTTIHLPYIKPNLSASKFDGMIEMVYGLSYYNYNVVVNHDDKLLALSTCTYSVEGHKSLPALNDYRFVIMARLVDPNEHLKDRAQFAVNRDRLEPDATLVYKNH